MHEVLRKTQPVFSGIHISPTLLRRKGDIRDKDFAEKIFLEGNRMSIIRNILSLI